MLRVSGWYDHEFGKHFNTAKNTLQQISWNWLSAQLDDGTELSTYELFDRETGERMPESSVIVTNASGSSERIEEFSLRPLEEWTSARTFASHPIKWKLEIPSLNISATVDAEFAAQEFITLISPPSFWEGSGPHRRRLRMARADRGPRLYRAKRIFQGRYHRWFLQVGRPQETR